MQYRHHVGIFSCDEYQVRLSVPAIAKQVSSQVAPTWKQYCLRVDMMKSASIAYGLKDPKSNISSILWPQFLSRGIPKGMKDTHGKPGKTSTNIGHEQIWSATQIIPRMPFRPGLPTWNSERSMARQVYSSQAMVLAPGLETRKAWTWRLESLTDMCQLGYITDHQVGWFLKPRCENDLNRCWPVKSAKWEEISEFFPADGSIAVGWETLMSHPEIGRVP